MKCLSARQNWSFACSTFAFTSDSFLVIIFPITPFATLSLLRVTPEHSSAPDLLKQPLCLLMAWRGSAISNVYPAITDCWISMREVLHSHCVIFRAPFALMPIYRLVE